MLRWLQLVLELAPIVFRFVPGGAALAPIAADAIQAAELIPGATGSQKLAHAQQLVVDGVAATNTAAGHMVIDPTIAAAVAPSAISTIVGVANAIHAEHKAAPAPA